ncbi:MAG: hypothetical protein CM15mP85_30260 [Rhodobacterales bacterium]|nr:MAG: hypothetical protein CM15mP85_30260 [Rhodobacterales bacterium]
MIFLNVKSLLFFDQIREVKELNFSLICSLVYGSSITPICFDRMINAFPLENITSTFAGLKSVVCLCVQGFRLQ